MKGEEIRKLKLNDKVRYKKGKQNFIGKVISEEYVDPEDMHAKLVIRIEDENGSEHPAYAEYIELIAKAKEKIYNTKQEYDKDFEREEKERRKKYVPEWFKELIERQKK